MAALLQDDNDSVSWPLEEFAVGKDLTSVNSTKLYVDRATHEFGVVYFDPNGAAALEQSPGTDEPIFFSAGNALAACWHSKSKKISILFPLVQIDLGFRSPSEARDFLDAFEDSTATSQNLSFCTYEHHSSVKFKETGFDMKREKISGRIVQPWMDAHIHASEWPNLRKTGDWSDFNIIAGEWTFPVHRVKLCKESDYFKAVCSGGFAETNLRSVELPEPGRIIDILLDEMYDTYNSTTGSLFTGFALRSEMEKERIINDLLDLFIAADKYNLEKIKTKVAKALIDRMPFIHDVMTIVELAACVFDDQCPQVDRGLRKATLSQLHDRMPSIIKDSAAWQEYTESKAVLRAFHAHVFDHAATGQPRAVTQAAQCPSPPATPMGGKSKRTS
ncbi:hypothetical protein OPT61_g4493 [Boeremia exigua]|uniref:Uncharacterized protein n=1 Tax=Boeremia exigua TaxID=749465 RepID=A0ACC2IDS1_9PLEO|nr:hypothetical protein OPT61_g4493 [Boeremia exigua]